MDADQLADTEGASKDWLGMSDLPINEQQSNGMNPFIAILCGGWYSLVAAGALVLGLKYLYLERPNGHLLLQNIAWAIGAGFGSVLAAILAKTHSLICGIISSLIPFGLLFAILPLLAHLDETLTTPSLFSFTPSPAQFIVGFSSLTLLSGVVGAFYGVRVKHEEGVILLRGLRHNHWFWLWIAVYAWVAMLPMCAYFFWLEIIGSWYVLIHPSLWLSEAWSLGWTWTFGMIGVIALCYGIGLSLNNVSHEQTAGVSFWKRTGLFLLGTFILAGPVSNIFLRLAIHGLKHLPDGITAHPWWIL